MTFTDSRGVKYVFDPVLHCGARNAGTFCIVGPEHSGNHWDGERAWVIMHPHGFPDDRCACGLYDGDPYKGDVFPPSHGFDSCATDEEDGDR